MIITVVQKILTGTSTSNFAQRMCVRTTYCSINTKSTNIQSEWVKPSGHPSGITVYNSLARAKVPLIFRNEDLVTWYSCGPTVYDEMHIGHAYSYVQFDIIRRILEKYFNYNVVMVMGVTDIDDKIIAKARQLNTTIQQVAKHYEQEFFTDLEKLHVLPPTLKTHVSRYIPQIIEFCDNIQKRGFAYSTPEGNLYFDVKKFGKFGKLSGISEEVNDDNERQGSRKLIDNAKNDPRDFALWKAVKPDEPWWEAPWGKGRPGWHIECSTMASCIFGSQLDIHSGGKDLLFPHHENEERQSEAYHETQQWANYWMHTGHLYLSNDTKMSKSLGNTISVKNFLKENLANDFRILCLSVPYRNGIEYSPGAMKSCRGVNRMFKEFLANAESYVDGELKCSPIDDVHLMKCLNETKQSVHHCFIDDFDTPQAMKEIINFVKEVRRNMRLDMKCNKARSPGVIAGCSSFVAETLELLGVKYTSKKQLAMYDTTAVLSNVLDSVMKFQSTIRVHVLTKESDIQPKHDVFSTQINSYKGSLNEGLSKEAVESHLEKGSLIQTVISPAMEPQREVNQKENDLLRATNELRSELSAAGIQLKELGKESVWSLIEDNVGSRKP